MCRGNDVLVENVSENAKGFRVPRGHCVLQGDVFPQTATSRDVLQGRSATKAPVKPILVLKKHVPKDRLARMGNVARVVKMCRVNRKNRVCGAPVFRIRATAFLVPKGKYVWAVDV